MLTLTQYNCEVLTNTPFTIGITFFGRGLRLVRAEGDGPLSVDLARVFVF